MLLAESLRRFGGKRSDMPLVAVRPRKGDRIAKATLGQLESLNVTVVEDDTLSRNYAWWSMMNKPAALGYVEAHSRTPSVTWIDGDMMILQEPDSFAPQFDFIARAGEAFDVASNGHDDGAEFWNRLCDKLGLDFSSFPEITSFPDGKPIKAYWQGGLFTYRKDAGFAAKFREIYKMILDGDIASKKAGTYHADQVSVALTVQALKLKFTEYDPRMNFNVNPLDKETSTKLPLSEVRIVQYHGSLWPESFPWARGLFPEDKRSLLDKYGPLGKGPPIARLRRKLRNLPRQRKVEEYNARVVKY